MMRLILLIVPAFLLLGGCGDSKQVNSDEIKKTIVLQKPAKVKQKKKKPPAKFINKNVVQKLTDYGKKNPETIVHIHTSKGLIKARLYKDTPLHRANFIMLAKKGYFDGTVFNRVVPGFIAQGGHMFMEDTRALRNSIGKYSIPAEFKKHHFHKKGVLAAARGYQNNPDKRSDPYSFYFVEGTSYSNKMLDHYEEENKYKYSQKQREYYESKLGAAHIDGEHTVFGEITFGVSVVSKLTSVETDTQDWPKTDIFITKVEVVE